MVSAGDPCGRPRAVIRAPNHLGELVLALPALEAAARSWPSPPLVQVVERLVPALRMSGADVGVLPLADRRRVVRAAAALRRHRPDVGVLLTPSFSAALIFALAGVRDRRGTATDGRTWLLTDPVDRAPLLRDHRVREYLCLVDAVPAPGAAGPGGDGGAAPGDRRRRRDGRGRPGAGEPPPPRLARLDRAREAWRELASRRGIGGDADRPVVGLAPGANAPARRWPADRYAELAGRLSAAGCAVRVFGGPGEASITREVAERVDGADDLGGRTDLWELAGGLAACDAVVGNDSGAAHLAAAAGRPLVVVWGSGDPRQTRPLATEVRVVARPDLPCHPCLESECPRRGAGYVEDEARRECLTALSVDEVESAARAVLGRSDGGQPRPGRADGPPGDARREKGGADA